VSTIERASLQSTYIHSTFNWRRQVRELLQLQLLVEVKKPSLSLRGCLLLQMYMSSLFRERLMSRLILSTNSPPHDEMLPLLLRRSQMFLMYSCMCVWTTQGYQYKTHHRWNIDETENKNTSHPFVHKNCCSVSLKVLFPLLSQVSLE